MAVVVTPCASNAPGIAPGKSVWKWIAAGTGGGWVLQGCHCMGLCCESPDTPGRPDEEQTTNCIPCPTPPDPNGPPENTGPSDKTKKK